MFDNDFEVYLCDTYESKLINYRTRYQVYCLETRFEDPQSFPEKLERDRYDMYSAHFAVRCKHSGRWIASSRLVMGKVHELPFAQLCDIDQRSSLTNVSRAAEISRVCILGAYRKAFVKDTETMPVGSNVVRITPRRKEPEILLGLLRAMHQYCRNMGVEDWFAMQSLPLARIVKAMGFNLYSIGPEVDYRGPRKPYHSRISEFAKDLRADKLEVARMFCRPGYTSFASLAAIDDERALV